MANQEKQGEVLHSYKSCSAEGKYFEEQGQWTSRGQGFEEQETTEKGSPNHTHCYQQGECNTRLSKERWKCTHELQNLITAWVIKGSAAGTTTEPCSHRTMKREFNPKSYSINEKGNSGYLFILPIA